MNRPSILQFLKQLAANNHKTWFDAHRATYDTCRQDFITLIAHLVKETAKFDPTLTHLKPQSCLFRIHRDIRFSPDKTPYKTHFGAFLGVNGKKMAGPGFFIHLAPGQTMVGGGTYRPTPEGLAALRQEIDYNPDPLIQITGSKDFQATFGELKGEKLKTAPKGYPKDHPYIDWLRMKSFYVVRSLSDEEVCAKTLVDRVAAIYQAAHPLNQYIKTAQQH